MMQPCRVWIAGFAGTLCAASGHAAIVAAPQDLVTLSLEELSDVRITSVSKREERLGDAPAAVFVITADDLRRSGARSLPEAMRLAPNLQVMMTTAGNYTITSRGLAGATANKLLVMIDGRSVYTPLYSGVFWDAQDVPMESIDRIEVISGPGGTLWGTNAVNGVINVITKPASATQGALLDATAGNRWSGATFRYGGTTANGAWRVYGMDFAVRTTENAAGRKLGDGWHKGQGGFRGDWQIGSDNWTVQGDAYRGRLGQPVASAAVATPENTAIGGVNVLGHWTRQLASGANVNVQTFYERTERRIPGSFEENLDIVDLQMLYRFAPLGRHDLAAGAQYRHAHDEVVNGPGISFVPARASLSWASLFAQDIVALNPDLKLTLGLRVERNIYTGSELLPNMRLAWKLSADRLLWGAVSRTVRAPSRLDRDVHFPGAPPYRLFGGPDFVSETARVFEVGYRHQEGRLSYSVNLYRALYDRLRTVAPGGPGRFAVIANGMEGATRGVEAWASYQVGNSWRLSAAITGLHEALELKPGQVDLARTVILQEQDPRHTAMLRSSWQIDERRDLDVTVRRVGKLGNPAVRAYNAVDARFGWRVRPNLDLSLGASNAVGPEHAEYGAVQTRSHIGPGVYLNAVSRF